MSSNNNITKADLDEFRARLIHEISQVLEHKAEQVSKRFVGRLRSKQVIEILGISHSTLHSYRVRGVLKARKNGGTYYYDPRELKKFGIDIGG